MAADPAKALSRPLRASRPAFAGHDDAVGPAAMVSRQGGLCSPLDEGADWPGRFRTQKIEMESMR
ncbi:MAG: hypothetical protein EBZ59_03895 [Planctomycetia bacterium]|nr:hypothetical protein [Planctomycetia bacterium]